MSESSNDAAYAASPTNTARAMGRQIRPDDGFHTRPVRKHRGWRKTLALAVVGVLGLIGAVLALRAITGADERVDEPSGCVLDEDICELLEPIDTP